MKYMVTFSIRPENFKAALARFQAGGAAPPAGIKLLGRWHEMGTGTGFAVLEVEDPVALTGFLMGWSDLLDQKVVPVVEDGALAANL